MINSAKPNDAPNPLDSNKLGGNNLTPPSQNINHRETERDSSVLQALDRIRQRVANEDEIKAIQTIEPKSATYFQSHSNLHPKIISYLEKKKQWPLYSHQGNAIERTLAQKHTVIAASTASGKSLCYQLPVLDSILKNENAYALFLYPTKALSQDQMRSLSTHLEGLELGAEAGVYDGDTSPVMRRKLKKNGRVILTNPDMLHASILPHHGGWAGLFSNLKYVVVDELHTLRGIFGAHVGSVIRRLRRIANSYGANPTFIATSATIGNPQEHASKLIGLPFELEQSDGAPRGRKDIVLWNPSLVDRQDGTSYRKGAPSVAVRLLPELIRRNVKSICFGKSRNTVELIHRYIRERNQRRTGYEGVSKTIEAYRGGYLPSERREIERKLFADELSGVISTNALELGIDIGSLSACLIAGWPGSVCSFLQQAGRAGRRETASLVFLIAGQEPVDQFFMRHPEALFDKNPETAIAQWDNPYVLVRHLICAAYELPLSEADEQYFGEDLLAMLSLLEEEGKLKETSGHWYYEQEEYPAAGVKLRSASEENFTILELGNNEVIGELDYVAAMLSLYEGAVYLHRTETHIVEDMDYINQVVKIRKTETGYYTQVLVQKQVTETAVWEQSKAKTYDLSLSEVDVINHITGYKKVRFHTLENIGFGKVNLPPLELDTVALVIEIAPEVVRSADPFGPDFMRSGLHGIARVFREMLSIVAMCDPADIDTFIDGQRIYVYDLYPGGIGYSEIAYEKFKQVLQQTADAVQDCECSAGCPSCVLPASTRVESYMEPAILEYPYPKEATLFLLHELLELESYEPSFDAVPIPAGEKVENIENPLSNRMQKKIRKAAKRVQ